MKRNRWLVSLAALCAIVPVLSACGPDAATPTTVPTATVPAPTATTEQPTATTAMATATTEMATATTMAPATATTASSVGGALNLSWWSVTNGQGWLDSYTAACADYAKKVTGFGCQIEVTTNGFTQLAADLTAGIGPDIYHTSGSRLAIAPYVKAGEMLPLTDAKFIQNAPKAATAPWTFDGKIYGAAIDSYAGGLYYNNDILSQNGLKPPTDLADLLSACDTLKTKNITPIAPMFGDSWTAGLLAVFIASTTVAGPDPTWFSQRVQNQVTFANSDGWKKMVQDIADMQSHGCFGDNPTATNYNDSESMFLAGKAAMWAQGTWAASDMQTKGADPTKIQLITFPASDAPDGSYLGISVGNGFNINPKGKDPQQALALLENTYGNVDTVKQFAKYNGGFTLYNPDAQSATSQPMFATFAKQFYGDKTTIWTADYMIGGTEQTISDLLQGMLSGSLTQDQVLSQLDDAWNTYQTEHPEVVDALK